MSTFERYLTLWVALCIVVGIALGHFLPGAFHAIGTMEIAKVNLPVAVLIWLMVIPMPVSYTHLPSPRDKRQSRMPSSA